MASEDDNDTVAIPQSPASGSVTLIPEDQRRWRFVILRSLDLVTIVTGTLTILVVISDDAPVPLLVADAAPIIAVLSIAVLMVGALLHGRHAAAAAVALVAAFITTVRIGPDLAAALFAGGAPTVGDLESLKVVTANVWSQNHNGRPFLRFVEKEQPDIVVVQEAYGRWKSDLDRLSPTYKIAAGCERPHDCNVVILTRLRFAHSGPAGDPCCATASLTLPTRLGGGPIRVTGLHLSRTGDRAKRGEELTSALMQASGARAHDILAGDMNALPWSTTIRYLDQHSGLRRITRFTPSWPTEPRFFPIMPIDHIYAGCGWRATSLRLGPNIGSDHYPVVTTLTPSSCDENR